MIRSPESSSEISYFCMALMLAALEHRPEASYHRFDRAKGSAGASLYADAAHKGGELKDVAVGAVPGDESALATLIRLFLFDLPVGHDVAARALGNRSEP